jgi:micrococcal nuclease
MVLMSARLFPFSRICWTTLSGWMGRSEQSGRNGFSRMPRPPERRRCLASAMASSGIDGVCAASLLSVAIGVIGLGLGLGAVPISSQAAEVNVVWTGWVSGVIDGDTVVLVRPGQSAPIKLRIEGIDAPETCQAGGSEARAAMVHLALKKAVQVQDLGQDVYGRHIGRLTLEGQDLGAEMVRTGQAWAYRFRTGSGPYARLQRQAQSQKAGLFAQAETAMSPSLFRKFHGPCWGV